MGINQFAGKWTVKRKSRNKYGAKRKEVDGRSFDSRREADRFAELKLLEACGYIRNLTCQVPFELHGLDGSKVCTYRADFVYWGGPGYMTQYVHECKGYWTPEAKLKKKLFLAEHKGFKYVES